MIFLERQKTADKAANGSRREGKRVVRGVWEEGGSCSWISWINEADTDTETERTICC